jgi:hypothetical protein
MITDVDPVFNDGQPGTQCSVPEPTEFRVAFEETTHNLGIISADVPQALGVHEIGDGLSGSMVVTPTGGSFVFTYHESPDRWGMAGGEGNHIDFDLSSLVVPGTAVVPKTITFCIHRGPTVTQQNPIFYRFLDAEGENLGTVSNGDPDTNPCTPIVIPEETETVRVQFLISGNIYLLSPTLVLDIYR